MDTTGDAVAFGLPLRDAADHDLERLGWCIGGEDRELVGADAADDVGGAEAVREDPGRVVDRRVTDLSTVGFVDRVQAVEVGDEDEEGAVAALRRTRERLGGVEEAATIEEPRDLVARGEAIEVLLLVVPLHRVAHHAAEGARRELVLADEVLLTG